MPGYHGTKVSFQPELQNMMHHARSREVLYPRHYPMGKMGHMMGPNPMANPMAHPMFEALRSRHIHDKPEYARMMRMRELSKMGEPGYPTFDSLKLLGADNDANYLDVFMNENAKHHRYPSDDGDIRPRARSCSQTSKNQHSSSKRNSVNVDSLKKTILGSLRSAASDENIYESVEVIQYRKTIEAIKRQTKLRSVPKTGHPLFDHLRVERVLKSSDRRQVQSNSDGGSNSQSSSGSGDEFDYTRKPNCRFSRREVLMSSRDAKKPQHPQETSHKHKNPKRDARKSAPAEAGSESDDDWAIPRPLIAGGNVGRSRRTGAPGLMTTGSHDESDSSSKSTGLR